jgi:predicted ATP-grasp superfamily ATP-dependent carboligase
MGNPTVDAKLSVETCSLGGVSEVLWEDRPRLNRPTLVAAFGGWNDAGDAATGALRFLAGKLHARSFATIEAEEFFDFSQSRPIIRLDDGITREVEWPTNRFTATSLDDGSSVIFLHGTEPQLKWKTFCELVLKVAKELDCAEVITLGSLLADVPHTRPAPLSVASRDQQTLEHLSIPATQYEGPTGIVGVLNQMAEAENLIASSLWVSVPHYVPQTPSPKAIAALAGATSSLLCIDIDVSELDKAAETYESQINQLVSSDEEISDYVAQLEAAEDTEDIDLDNLADEAERFLREH